MAPTVAQVLARFKADVGQALSANVIEQVCVDLNHRHRERVTPGPPLPCTSFSPRCFTANTACTHLPHLTGKQFSAASYCDASRGCRMAASSSVIFSIASPRALTCSVAAAVAVKDSGTDIEPGHLDGSSFSMSDRPGVASRLRVRPGTSRRAAWFPRRLHPRGCSRPRAGFLQRIIASPLRTHDMANAADMHAARWVRAILLVADRGFASFAHLALISPAKSACRLPLPSETDRRLPPAAASIQDELQGACRFECATSRWIKRLGK